MLQLHSYLHVSKGTMLFYVPVAWLIVFHLPETPPLPFLAQPVLAQPCILLWPIWQTFVDYQVCARSCWTGRWGLCAGRVDSHCWTLILELSVLPRPTFLSSFCTSLLALGLVGWNNLLASGLQHTINIPRGVSSMVQSPRHFKQLVLRTWEFMEDGSLGPQLLVMICLFVCLF